MKQHSEQEALVTHYQSLLATHGDAPQALQYRDQATQLARFQVLSEIAKPLDSVLDVGCGMAHLYGYLKSTGFTGQYVGVDIVPEFIKHATDSFADDDNTQFLLQSSTDTLPTNLDYAFVSGVFNNTMDDNEYFMKQTLQNMFSAAKKGIAFNAMSTYVDYRDEALYYVDPMEIFAYCKFELGGHPVLRHDYILSDGGYPFEFAMYVYKAPYFASVECHGDEG